ncbi:hypothetical protein BCV69DRAFT_313497 [Microstroma glucosiphilum]|uniref:Uncharacterized protein n=1 Tax=Pseudomicrostroma glucosiphilum TaxID=1684307 RepID=A0A316U370_9BASI|nr:hypothetical protein BCV69DRAFT_313497 [Pseudomicrostroma glucosiphilum]PWN19752.1 hypothetical protein BCV69DRAFT_313497 [Pseudomicrostroma glucosiphilum]
MKDWQRSPEPEAMMGPRGVKRSRLSTPEDEQVARADTTTDDMTSLNGIPGPGPATQESRQALAAKAAEDRAIKGASRKARLMSLAEMSFRTVISHLASADEETVSEVSSYAPSLNPRYSGPLLQACKDKAERLRRLERAKVVAAQAREREKISRPTAIAIQTSADVMMGRNGRPIKRAEKTAGGRRMWAKAAAAAGKRR